MNNWRFIVTGGPGSGKTSLVEAAGREGYACFPEIARDLILQGVTPPVWSEKPDSGRFFELVLQSRIDAHQQVKCAEIAFYDRGIPDSLAYFRFQNLKVPRILSEAIDNYRYNQMVFAAPPWEQIYHNDTVRKETWSESVELYEITLEEYRRIGYTIVELPEIPVAERLVFMLNQPIEPQNDK